MPVKKDDSGKRFVEMEILVPGTPEAVWQAMATGPGNSAWFTKTEIEEHVGGVLKFDFGPDGGSTGEVTTWEPPLRFGYVEREWCPGAPPVATEITITSRSGDECVMRMVHSLFTSSDEWDDQLEGFESGWPGFFAVLRLYLKHFAGLPAASTRVTATLDGTHTEAWTRIASALELTDAKVGQTWSAPSGAPPLAGTIEQVQQEKFTRSLLLRLEKPSHGIASLGSYSYGGLTRGIISLYFYGEHATATTEAAQRAWSAWFSQLSPAPAAPINVCSTGDQTPG